MKCIQAAQLNAREWTSITIPCERVDYWSYHHNGGRSGTRVVLLSGGHIDIDMRDDEFKRQYEALTAPPEPGPDPRAQKITAAVVDTPINVGCHIVTVRADMTHHDLERCVSDLDLDAEGDPAAARAQVANLFTWFVEHMAYRPGD